MHLEKTDHEIRAVVDSPLSAVDTLEWFVDATKLELWWPGTLETTGEVGSPYRVHFAGIPATMMGTVLRRSTTELEFSWAWDNSPEDVGTTVRVATTPTDGGCQVVLNHGEYHDAAPLQDSHYEGWAHFLPGLEKHLAAAGDATRA